MGGLTVTYRQSRRKRSSNIVPTRAGQFITDMKNLSDYVYLNNPNAFNGIPGHLSPYVKYKKKLGANVLTRRGRKYLGNMFPTYLK